MIRAITKISYYSSNLGNKIIPKHFGIFSEFMTSKNLGTPQNDNNSQRDYDNDESSENQNQSAFGKSSGEKAVKSDISSDRNQERSQVDSGKMRSEYGSYKNNRGADRGDTGDRVADRSQNNERLSETSANQYDRNKSGFPKTRVYDKESGRNDFVEKESNYNKSDVITEKSDRGNSQDKYAKNNDRSYNRVPERINDKSQQNNIQTTANFDEKLLKHILMNDTAEIKLIVGEQFGLTDMSQDFIQQAQKKIWNDTTINQHKVQHTSSINKGSKDYQNKSFTRSPRQNFSQIPEQDFHTDKSNQVRLEGDKSPGSGFLYYLQKAKTIDDQAIDIVKDSPNIFEIKKDEKRTTFTKTEYEKTKQVKRNTIQQVFQPVVSSRKSQQTIEAVPIQSKTQVVEEWIKNPELLTQATLQINELLQSEEKVKNIEEYFENIEQTDDIPLYAQRAFLNQFSSKMENKFLLFKIFCNPLSAKTTKSNIPKVDLQITLENQHGLLEKDYRTYLGEYTSFPYEVLPQMYDLVLSVMQMQDGQFYKKKLFKRIAGHLAQFGSGKILGNSTLDIICDIATTQKTPLTLIEITTLFLKRDIQMTQSQVFKVINLVKRYKDYDQECDKLLVDAFAKYSWTLEYKTFANYVENLIDGEESERHLNLYEMLKDSTMHGKASKIEQKDLVVVPKKAQVMNYVNGYVDALLYRQQIDLAQKVLSDVKVGKFPLDKHFYGQWIQSHAFDVEQATKIMDDYILKFPDQVDETIIQRFCYVVQKNSTKLVEYFNQIATAYIFSFKVNLTPDFVHELSKTFMNLRDYTSFASMAKIIYDKRLPVHPESRLIWIKIMKKCPDDGQRGQIRAAIEQVFANVDVGAKKFKDRKKSPLQPFTTTPNLALPAPNQQQLQTQAKQDLSSPVQQNTKKQVEVVNNKLNDQVEASFSDNIYLDIKEKKKGEAKSFKHSKYGTMKQDNIEEEKKA